MALADENQAAISNNRPSLRYRFVISIIIVISPSICDRVSATFQQRQFATPTGLSNDNINDDYIDGGGGNELARQIDLPGKQLVMDDADLQQRRSDWPTEQRASDDRQDLRPTELDHHHHFISVLNNQSNIITSPRLTPDPPLKPNGTHRPNTVGRPELDPHLREDLTLLKVAQNDSRSKEQNTEGLSRGAGGSTSVKLMEQKRAFGNNGKKDALLLVDLLPYLARQPFRYLTPEQRLVEYLSSFNATRDGDSLVTSSSQPANEFETTIMAGPPPNQEPIVAGSDASGVGPANDPDDIDEEDEDGGGGSGSDDDVNWKDPPKVETPMRDGLATNLEGSNGSPKNGTLTTATPTGPAAVRPPPVAPEQELLVGPFKSEAEAPATITLSGIVYQKSGARAKATLGAPQFGGTRDSSLFPVGGHHGAQFEGENLSASDSSRVAHRPRPGLLVATVEGAPIAEVAPAAGPFRSPLGGFTRPKSQTNSSSSSNNPRFGGLHEPSPDSGAPGRSAGLRAALSPLPQQQQQQQLLMSHYLAGQQQLAESLTAAPTSASYSSAGLLDAEQQPTAGWPLSMDELDGSASGKRPKEAKGSAKHEPLVIVQKDVKPVKYHLMRAYLKLRRLLRPYEATYVFLN